MLPQQEETAVPGLVRNRSIPLNIFVKLDLEEVRQLIVLLRRCSNNLNQYAKRADETGSVYAADIEDLQSRLDEIWELSRQSLAHLANIR